jgi:hypothetical protein
MSSVRQEVANALREMKRRARARESLHSFCLNVQIPTVATDPPCPDEDLFGSARELMELHHALICDVLQRCMTTYEGRCMIFAPPGTAKSMYTSVMAPAWYMGLTPGCRLILLSYASDIAELQSGRIQDVVRQDRYRLLYAEEPRLASEAVGNWETTTKCEVLAVGIGGAVTGNRANGLIVDDPVKGAEQADSDKERKTTLKSYNSDCLTRLLPGAWIAFIMTRWSEQDLAGSILPDDYDGRSGPVLCKDGKTWEVLNLQAKCERHDDPLGRQIGEYIWPSYYKASHWQQFEFATGSEAARTWSSLMQGRPAPAGDETLTMEDLNATLYKPGTAPLRLAKVGAGDYAVTPGKNDFTELGVFGKDVNGVMWEVDWWHKQCDTGKGAEETLNMISRHRIPMWFNEGGVIDKAMKPLLNLRMRARAAGDLVMNEETGLVERKPPDFRCVADFRVLPSTSSKTDRIATFKGLVKAGLIRFREGANTQRIFQQLLAGTAGRNDDAMDVCSLIGRAADQFPVVFPEPEPETADIKAFSSQWLEYEAPVDQNKYRLCI